MITDFAFDVVLKIINKIFASKDVKTNATLALMEMQTNGELEAIQAQSRVVRAEIKSESWLARNWRPITMLSFVLIIINNYIICPYAMVIGFSAPSLPIPPDMWSLLKIGLGGYVVGRSVEKGIREWKKS